MEIILVSNNIIENNLIYSENNDKSFLLDKVKEYGKMICVLDIFQKTDHIFSSNMPDAKIFAKSLALRLNKRVLVSNNLNECKIGKINNHDLEDIYFMQEHDFNIKLSGGESLNEACKRFEKQLDDILFNYGDKAVIFTHQRIILSYLLKVCNYDYTYDDRLVVDFDEEIVYDGQRSDVSIYRLKYRGNKLLSVKVVPF